ncbi:MAG: ABC transporter ATP-binding protein [Acidimicrobiia bacterium]|nr:ABC transporter ATP-binding protein [Acidimicrobiia bacterium]
MSNGPAIVTRGLTKHYGEVRALEDLNLEIAQGEIFGFLGPNGAGKTTTMRTILDLIRPTSGTATIMGLDSHEDAVEIRQHIGYVPGDLAMYPKLTGRELLTYFANLRGGVSWSVVDEFAGRLDSDLSRKIGNLSSGNRQKVGLIQAFMNKPDILILDEPSSGLDPLVQQEFQAMLREVAGEGRTVFLSSHTLSEVERVADRVAIIREGRLAVVDTMESLKEKAIRKVTLHFADPISESVFAGVAGVKSVSVKGTAATVSFEGAMSSLLRAATDHDVINLTSSEADLEEIFLAYYRGPGTSEVVG